MRTYHDEGGKCSPREIDQDQATADEADAQTDAECDEGLLQVGQVLVQVQELLIYTVNLLG